MSEAMNLRELKYCDLGLIDYKEAWDLQKKIFDMRVNNELPDIFLQLEHPHTYTLGKVADKNNLIGSQKYLDDNKISVYEIDRGGDITYHGPGQIVGYPIISLTDWQMDTHKYLRGLEEVIIRTLKYYGVEGTRNPKYTGVWIEDRKIAAIGIKVSRWITMHGFAFNINSDLSFFSGIIPCGIIDKAVTSLQQETSKSHNIQEVKELLLINFNEFFGYSLFSTLVKEELLLLTSQSLTSKGI